MGWKNRLVERGKQLAMTPRVLKVLSDDRVMRAAEGVMDARNRVRAAAEKANEAWQLLTYGHALPAIDPSMVDDVDLEVRTAPTPSKVNGDTPYAPFQKSNGNGTTHTNGNGHTAVNHAHSADGRELAASMASRTSLSAIGGRDVFEKAYQFRAADNARKMGLYPFFRPLDLNDGPEAVLEGRRVVMFGS